MASKPARVRSLSLSVSSGRNGSLMTLGASAATSCRHSRPVRVPVAASRFSSCSWKIRDRREASCDFDAERAGGAVNDLEWRPELGRILVVGLDQVGSSQLLLSHLGKRMRAAAEQCSHLLGSHWVAGGQAVDAVQARTDPHPGRFTAFGVVGRQSGVTFLGRIQSGDLPGEIVIKQLCLRCVDLGFYRRW